MKYFELRRPKTSFDLDNLENFETYRSYYKELFIDEPVGTDYTFGQKYLRDLQEIVSPVLSTFALKARMSRLRPRTGEVGASSRLERTAQLLSFESYHFKQRLKNFGTTASEAIPDGLAQQDFRRKLGKIVKDYSTQNERLLRYRNFVVHGPGGRLDEFKKLRSWELGGLIHHSDLWFEYNTAFSEVQEDWVVLAKSLLKSMELRVAETQHLNENILELRLIWLDR